MQTVSIYASVSWISCFHYCYSLIHECQALEDLWLKLLFDIQALRIIFAKLGKRTNPGRLPFAVQVCNEHCMLIRKDITLP